MKNHLESRFAIHWQFFVEYIFAPFQEVPRGLSKHYKCENKNPSSCASTWKGKGSDGQGDCNVQGGMGMEKPSQDLPVLQDVRQTFGIIHTNRRAIFCYSHCCGWGWRWERGERRRFVWSEIGRRWFVNDMLLHTHLFLSWLLTFFLLPQF